MCFENTLYHMKILPQMFTELREHFSLSNTNNVIELSRLNTLPNNVLEDNDIILLEIEARRLRAASVWTSVVLEIVKQQVIAPVFSQAYYTGLYTKETELTFIETINITEGYDEVITFALNGGKLTFINEFVKSFGIHSCSKRLICDKSLVKAKI